MSLLTPVGHVLCIMWLRRTICYFMFHCPVFTSMFPLLQVTVYAAHLCGAALHPAQVRAQQAQNHRWGKSHTHPDSDTLTDLTELRQPYKSYIKCEA